MVQLMDILRENVTVSLHPPAALIIPGQVVELWRFRFLGAVGSGGVPCVAALPSSKASAVTFYGEKLYDVDEK